MRTAPRIGSGLVGWRSLAVVAAVADVVVLLGYGLTRGDREALAFAVVMLVVIGLLRVGQGLLGLLALAALFVNIEFWMLPAAHANATYRTGLVDLLIPASLVAFSLAGFVGAVAAIARHREPGAGRGIAGPTSILVGVFVFSSLGLVWAMTKEAPQVAPEGALEVQSINVAFVPKSLQASRGEITVALRNRDLFWHTLTIDALGVDLRTPVGRLRSATFQAEPGTYRFYCRIPSHTTLGMRGTLTVR
jgi:plastocyanin